MNTPPSQKKKPLADSQPQPGASESQQSIETFPRRAKRPIEAGLANEARPGLGMRADKPGQPDPGAKAAHLDANSREGERSAPPTPPTQRPEPSEQDSDSLEQQEQRDTGVSGHMGGT